MNAREAMKALLDGKILTAYGSIDYRLNDAGIIEQSGHTAPAWHEYPIFMNNNPKIVEEYPLTFKEAVMAMLDGKIVVSEVDSDTQNKFDCDRFYAKPKFTDWVEAVGFAPGETEGKWKVVEE